MRLLQLATGPQELIDLHPHVTVLTGLSDEQRTALAATVGGLASGKATGTVGLVEAHGVLFDLTHELLSQIDPSGEDVNPVVRAADLPMSRVSATARRDLTTAEHALGVLQERAAVADQTYASALGIAAAAREAVERAQRMVDDHDADAQVRITTVDDVTAKVDQAIERARQAEETVATLRPQLEQATARRAEVEAETIDVRTRHQDALTRAQQAAIALEQARTALDADAAVVLAAAEDQLASVEAAVAEERAAHAALADEVIDLPSLEELEARQAEVTELLDDMAKRRAAFAPASREAVAAQLERLQSIDGAERVESPEAHELADRIDAVDAELAALPAPSGSTEPIAAVKARLDEARQAHLEAEQAVRNPELDRTLVDKLETIHSSLLDVMDKVDGRFGGARAQKKLDELRSQEHAVLDQLGFTSYSDYMMGNSLLHVDPEKEAQLEASRSALSLVEDEWRGLQLVTDAELSRAEVYERRRLLVEEAREMLGRPAGAASIAAELREHRVEGATKVAAARDLQLVLANDGLELGSHDLPLDEVVLVAEAWIEEVDQSGSRQEAFEAEYQQLEEERGLIAAALRDARERQDAAPEIDPEVDWVARVDGARRAVDAASARAQANDEARLALASLEAELAAATDAEAQAGNEAAAAEAAVAAAVATEAPLAEALAAADAELEEAKAAEITGQEALRELEESGPEASAEALQAALASTSAAHAAADAELRAATATKTEVEEQQLAAEAAVAAARAAAGSAPDDASVAEEVEWYLLARLAAQRSVSLGGSTPLLLDDALRGLAEDDLQHVLDRLERMAEAVQVIVVSEDPKVSSWALLAGHDRAAVVRPEPAPAG